ncbi:MAG: hypothetical protein AB8C84_07225 [Oligoflexales bacterium]
MRDYIKKNQRLVTILKMRKVALENEQKVFSDLLFEKQNLEQRLNEYQKQYLEGVDKVNQLRSSSERHSLSTFEDLADHAKLNWSKSHIELSNIQRRVQMQGKKLQEAHASVKAAEEMKHRTWQELANEVSRQEQESQDDSYNWKYNM